MKWAESISDEGTSHSMPQRQSEWAASCNLLVFRKTSVSMYIWDPGREGYLMRGKTRDVRRN